MMRIEIGYPPADIETKLMLEPRLDRVEEVPRILDPEQLLELQRAVNRVGIDQSIGTYLQALISATRSSAALATGASTRAGMSLAHAARARALLEGRDRCIPDDIHSLAVPLLAHRVRLAAHSEGYAPAREEVEAVVKDVVDRVPVPL
jgi:MoxR-like ATPase